MLGDAVASYAAEVKELVVARIDPSHLRRSTLQDPAAFRAVLLQMIKDELVNALDSPSFLHH
jgi:hypothetical protein